MKDNNTLVSRLTERALEAGYPKNELYLEAKERIEQLEGQLNKIRENRKRAAMLKKELYEG